MRDFTLTPLAATALLHTAIAAGSAIALTADGSPILGVHPAAKPLKFAVSIAILLGTLALLVPRLAISGPTRAALEWTFALTMIVEMVVILAQAMRGTTSHFNTGTRLDSIGWLTMLVAILIATAAMVVLAVIATVRPLALPAVVATAVRVGLWLLLLAAVSGFAMGGRLRHSVGGLDGEPGQPLTNWSRTHGDLRAPHFFALHGLQALPVIALGVHRLGPPPGLQWAVVLASCAGWVVLCVATLAQALAGRAFRGG